MSRRYTRCQPQESPGFWVPVHRGAPPGHPLLRPGRGPLGDRWESGSMLSAPLDGRCHRQWSGTYGILARPLLARSCVGTIGRYPFRRHPDASADHWRWRVTRAVQERLEGFPRRAHAIRTEGWLNRSRRQLNRPAADPAARSSETASIAASQLFPVVAVIALMKFILPVLLSALWGLRQDTGTDCPANCQCRWRTSWHFSLPGYEHSRSNLLRKCNTCGRCGHRYPRKPRKTPRGREISSGRRTPVPNVTGSRRCVRSHLARGPAPLDGRALLLSRPAHRPGHRLAPTCRYRGRGQRGPTRCPRRGAELAGYRPYVSVPELRAGNAVNPLTSLVHPVASPNAALPSWRGDRADPPDEPQARPHGRDHGPLLS